MEVEKVEEDKETMKMKKEIKSLIINVDLVFFFRFCCKLDDECDGVKIVPE